MISFEDSGTEQGEKDQHLSPFLFRAIRGSWRSMQFRGSAAVLQCFIAKAWPACSQPPSVAVRCDGLDSGQTQALAQQRAVTRMTQRRQHINTPSSLWIWTVLHFSQIDYSARTKPLPTPGKLYQRRSASQQQGRSSFKYRVRITRMQDRAGQRGIPGQEGIYF